MHFKLYIFTFLYFCTGIFFAQERDTLITKPNGGLKHASRMVKSERPRCEIERDTFIVYECMVIPNKNGPGPDPAEQGYIPPKKDHAVEQEQYKGEK